MDVKLLKASCEALYQRVFALMKTHRARGESDLAVEPFFRSVLGEEKYAYWKGITVRRLVEEKEDGWKREIPHYLEVLDADGNVISTVDVRDSTYTAKADAEQARFVAHEQMRRDYGLWVRWPAFHSLPKEEQERRVAEDYMAPYVRVFSGPEYFLLLYITVNDITESLMPPTYSRKTAQLMCIWESLYKVPIPKGVTRQGVITPKSRRSRFTTNIQAYQLNYQLSQGRKFASANTLDAENKVNSFLGRYGDMYLSVPRWLRSSLTGVPMEQLAKKKQSKAGEFSYSTADDPARLYVSIDPGDDRPKYDNRVVVVGGVPSKLEGEGINLVFSDEFGLCSDGDKLFKRICKILADGTNTIVGQYLVGGVTSDNRDALATMKEMFNSPESYNLFSLFIGIHHYKYTDPNTGWADEQRAITEVRENRKGHQDKGERDLLQQSYMQDAIVPADCFRLTGATTIDQAKVQQRIEDIQTALEKGPFGGGFSIDRGWFRENLEDYLNPHWVPDPQGGWHIREMPDKASRGNPLLGPTDNYVAGSDNSNRWVNEEGAAEANAGGGKLSRSCMIIGKTWRHDLVAMYFYRHSEPAEDYLQMLLGSLYYNCKNLPEYNKEGQGDFIYKFAPPAGCSVNYGTGFFRKWGFVVPLADRGQNSKRAHWIGTDNSGELKKERYRSHILPFFAKKLEHVPFIRLLESVAEWDIDNPRNTPDEGMGLLCQRVAVSWMTEKGPKEQPQTESKEWQEDRDKERKAWQRLRDSRNAQNALRNMR